MDTRLPNPPPYIMPGVCKIALHSRLFQFPIFFLLEGSSRIKNVTEFLNYLLCHHQTFIFVHMTNYICMSQSNQRFNHSIQILDSMKEIYQSNNIVFLPQSMAPLLCSFQKTWLTLMWISINPISFPIVNCSPGCTELDLYTCI